jgi:uncharacterized protein YecE (DUF72 family)
LADLRIGTSGWVYDFWVGGFYPTNTPSSDYLKMYSKIFNIVEIDNSFYRFPTAETTREWAEQTPDDFAFTAKIHRRISQEKRLSDFAKDLEYMYSVFAPLKEKLKVFVLQLPPSFSFEGGAEKLARFTAAFDPNYRLAVELRHDSWFRKETYDLLRASKVALAWSEIPFATNPGVVTTDFVYLRFIGERDIPKGRAGRRGEGLSSKEAEVGREAQERTPWSEVRLRLFEQQVRRFRARDGELDQESPRHGRDRLQEVEPRVAEHALRLWLLKC